MLSVCEIPLFKRVSEASSVLIAGCGGGFDVYCGIPLALALRRQNKRVTLANLTFAAPRLAEGAELVSDTLTRIDASCKPSEPYFPEWYLAQWLKSRGEPNTVYCFERTGVVPLREAYANLIERESIDAVIVVDGGTDSLMRGDEPSLATPHEDVATLLALESMDLPCFLVCVGFGIDTFHGICHASFLENVAALSQAGGFLGTFSLLPQQAEARAYLEAVRFATDSEPGRPSIVNTSVAAAVEGHFGNYQSTARTHNSELFINPLMGINWCFELSAVVERILYKDYVRGTQTFSELLRYIEAYRQSLKATRPRRALPV